MTVDVRDLAEFAERLADLGPIRFKRMFGGAGFWLGDQMFAIYAEGSFMLRADGENAPQFTARGVGPWVPGMMPSRAGKTVAMPYYAIPDEVLDDAALLCDWARQSVEAAERAAHAKARKKK